MPHKTRQKLYGSGGIRTHASEETGALNQRLRPLGHATQIRGSRQESMIEWGAGLVFVGSSLFNAYKCLRPYHVESTSSRPITEVKQHRVALVLGWVTAWEYAML